MKRLRSQRSLFTLITFYLWLSKDLNPKEIFLERCFKEVGNVLTVGLKSLNYLLNQRQIDQFTAKSVGEKEGHKNSGVKFKVIGKLDFPLN